MIAAVRGSYRGPTQPADQAKQDNAQTDRQPPQDNGHGNTAATENNSTERTSATAPTSSKQTKAPRSTKPQSDIQDRENSGSQRMRQQDDASQDSSNNKRRMSQSNDDTTDQPTKSSNRRMSQQSNDNNQDRTNQNNSTDTTVNRPSYSSPRLNADQQNLMFKVGDRVDVNLTQMMPPNTKWYRATVIKVNTDSLGDVLDYDVQLDTVDGSEEVRDHIPRRPNWIRASTGASDRSQQTQNRQTENGDSRNQDSASRQNNSNPDGLTFAVGDRVEVNVTQMMPPNTKWYPATVVKVNTNSMGDILDYDVKLDTTDGSEVVQDHIPKRANWIRSPR